MTLSCIWVLAPYQFWVSFHIMQFWSQLHFSCDFSLLFHTLLFHKGHVLLHSAGDIKQLPALYLVSEQFCGFFSPLANELDNTELFSKVCFSDPQLLLFSLVFQDYFVRSNLFHYFLLFTLGLKWDISRLEVIRDLISEIPLTQTFYLYTINFLLKVYAGSQDTVSNCQNVQNPQLLVILDLVQISPM